jgi:hypothetical protein
MHYNKLAIINQIQRSIKMRESIKVARAALKAEKQARLAEEKETRKKAKEIIKAAKAKKKIMPNFDKKIEMAIATKRAGKSNAIFVADYFKGKTKNVRKDKFLAYVRNVAKLQPYLPSEGEVSWLQFGNAVSQYIASSSDGIQRTTEIGKLLIMPLKKPVQESAQVQTITNEGIDLSNAKRRRM